MTPTLTINLKDLNNFTEILEIMKGISSYVYTFRIRTLVLKHGMSEHNNERNGDRLYRQAGHLPGWPTRLSGSSGSDMRLILDRWYEKTGEKPTRYDITIDVYDLTHVPDHCRTLENHLIDEHVVANGNTPIGNIDVSSRRRVVRQSNLKALNGFLDWSD